MEQFWNIISGTVALICVVLLFGFALWYCLKRSGDPSRLIFKLVVSIAVFIFTLSLMHRHPQDPGEMFWNLSVALVFLTPVGFWWIAPTVEFLTKPLTNIFDGGDEEVELTPLYSMAETKRKNSLYQEALREVQVQLEQFPGDFTGTLLHASIQAEDLNDLPGATITLEKILATGKLTPHQTTASLQQLADWHLQYAQDPAAAQAFLQRIVDLYPDSALAHQAQQRLARMESVDAILQEHEKTGTYELKQGRRNIGLDRTVRAPEPEPDHTALAAKYVQQLERHPMDAETRERLAVLYAEQFQRLDLALDQLEQLIAHPNETAGHIGRWLNLVATLHIRHNRDMAAAKHALDRLIERFPKSAAAYAAETRLVHLSQELKGLDAGQTKALGTYEGKLGLRKSSAETVNS